MGRPRARHHHQEGKYLGRSPDPIRRRGLTQRELALTAPQGMDTNSEKSTEPPAMAENSEQPEIPAMVSESHTERRVAIQLKIELGLSWPRWFQPLERKFLRSLSTSVANRRSTLRNLLTAVGLLVLLPHPVAGTALFLALVIEEELHSRGLDRISPKPR